MVQVGLNTATGSSKVKLLLKEEEPGDESSARESPHREGRSPTVPMSQSQSPAKPIVTKHKSALKGQVEE